MNDAPIPEWPKRCIPTEHFTGTFPVTMKNARGKPITGQVLGYASRDCYRVKWDHLKQPWVLHSSFFRVVPFGKDHPNEA